MRILDRYVLRSFFEPFVICFLGFIAIWLVFDLSDNGPDFIEAKASLKQVAGFYATQLPQTIIISLPVGLLLALLFSLSKMSRSNEIIAMLSAGRSVPRIMLPLLFVGFTATGICMWLNYELAPHSEAIKEVALERIRRERKSDEKEAVDGYLFRDRQNLRTWYVRKLRFGDRGLDGVHITQQDAEGNIITKWYAARAMYDAKSRIWVLNRGMTVHFDKEGNVKDTDVFPTGFRNMTDWDETPERIASGNMQAQNLSVPELRDYLRYNADFPAVQLASFRTYLHHRLALPWACLVVVLIATPLGIVFSRRGVLAGVASSIFIFFGMIFITNLFLALGRGARISPVLAGWMPNAIIGAVGLLLLYFRATNRELPRIFSRR